MSDQDYYLYIKTKYQLDHHDLTDKQKQECKWIIEEIEAYYKGDHNEQQYNNQSKQRANWSSNRKAQTNQETKPRRKDLHSGIYCQSIG